MSEVLWRRLSYMLTPQMDVYTHIAPFVAGERVIDIGSGTGFGTLQLLRTAEKVYGVEIDVEAMRFAEQNIPGITWGWGDISRGVDYFGSDFDTALMIEVLEHVEEWELALENVVRILRPGGRLIISARNANADLRKNELHEREWRADEFVDALKNFFSIVCLYDYKLENILDITTRQTPLVAVATKGQGNA